jgi:hypothetical protein
MDGAAVVTDKERLTTFLRELSWHSFAAQKRNWRGDFHFPVDSDHPATVAANVTWRQATAQSRPSRRQPGVPHEEAAKLDFVAAAATRSGVPTSRGDRAFANGKKARRAFARSLLTPESEAEVDRLVLEAIEVLAVFQVHSE